MLRPHSFLWHYLWVGPDVLLGLLAVVAWHRGLRKPYPAFFAYLVFESVQGLTLYALDLLPSVSADAYWRAAYAGLVIEGFVKLAVIRELFGNLIRPRPRLAGSGRRLIFSGGAVLFLLAALVAAHAPVPAREAPSWAHTLSHVQALNEATYLVEAGLLLFIFLFAAYHRMAWNRRDFGIALGLSISACVGLGVYAIVANGAFFKERYLLDIFNEGTYHGCVLLWWYYLLTPSHPGAIPVGIPAGTDEAATSDSSPLRRLRPVPAQCRS
jgi:hypothetical protein